MKTQKEEKGRGFWFCDAPLYHCCSSFLSKLVDFCSSLSWSSGSFLDCLWSGGVSDRLRGCKGLLVFSSAGPRQGRRRRRRRGEGIQRRFARAQAALFVQTPSYPAPVTLDSVAHSQIAHIGRLGWLSCVVLVGRVVLVVVATLATATGDEEG
jgi:hypothetical protein